MPDQPLTARGVATRDRIVEVATKEFAEHGIAGARIERIVAAARTNKAQLYGYFGSKEGLFDAIFAGSLERIVTVVPVDADDLADWAVRLYDEYLRRPDLIRLATWARLERRPTGHLVADADRVDDHKLRAIAEAQAAGIVRPGDPFDVMALVPGQQRLRRDRRGALGSARPAPGAAPGQRAAGRDHRLRTRRPVRIPSDVPHASAP
jgi:AcrR family transcriptional regulator